MNLAAGGGQRPAEEKVGIADGWVEFLGPDEAAPGGRLGGRQLPSRANRQPLHDTQAVERSKYTQWEESPAAGVRGRAGALVLQSCFWAVLLKSVFSLILLHGDGGPPEIRAGPPACFLKCRFPGAPPDLLNRISGNPQSCVCNRVPR